MQRSLLPRTAEGAERGASSLRFISENALCTEGVSQQPSGGIRRLDCCNCLISFLLGDLNDNESPKSIWLGAREKEEGGGEERGPLPSDAEEAVGKCRTDRARGERKRNEK